MDNERLIHGIKTALACVLGFLVTRSVHFPVDQWLIITILVVMCAQLNVGSMLQKSTMRFLGTLIGTIIAILTLLIFSSNPIPNAAVVTVAAFIFSYIATGKSQFSEAGPLGAVTIAIILLNQHPTILTGFERFIEISIGILIAALVSQFILPIQARAHLRRNQAATLKKLRDYYFSTLMRHEDQDINLTEQDMDEAIAQSLITQRKLAKDSVNEYFSKAFNLKYFQQLLWCEKEILRSIVFMHHALQMSSAKSQEFIQQPQLITFNRAVCQTLEEIASNIETQSSKKINLPNIQILKNAFSHENQSVAAEDIFYVNAIIFCAEILIERLAELIKLTH